MSADTDAWIDAMAAEHAAIFGYGVVGAHLDAAGQGLARQAEAAHRDRRDALALRIAAAGGTPTPAAPGYTLPFPVTDAPGAMRLAATLEEAAAAGWRRAIGGTTGDDRRFALDGLIACAVQATRWRAAAGITPATVPFPGASTG